MTPCGYRCVGAEVCATACVAKEAGLTAVCAGCFGALSHCTAASCLWQCAGGPSDGCAACVAEECAAAFEACSGFMMPGPAAE